MLPYIYHIQQVQIPDVPDMMCFSLPVFCVFSKKIVSKLSKCYRSRDSSIHLSSMDLNIIQIYFTFFAFYESVLKIVKFQVSSLDFVKPGNLKHPAGHFVLVCFVCEKCCEKHENEWNTLEFA